MSKHIHLFEVLSAYTEQRTNNYEEPWVSKVRENGQINYNKTKREKMLEIPLTFEILSDGYVNWLSDSFTSVIEKTIEYSKDNGETWTEVTSSTGGTHIDVVSGDTVMFRGNNPAYADLLNYNFNTFGNTTCNFNAKGNIMSLINSTGFADLTTLNSAYTFSSLFYECGGLVNAKHLILPATTLSESCYDAMFAGCTSLTNAPELPATTLTNYCYLGMFEGCSNLITPPDLPATTLGSFCYGNMFQGCTSLTTAPELPSTTLAERCYKQMFYGCCNLITAPELPATVVTDGCYQSMFSDCTSLTGVPSDYLPATTLVDWCYDSMFKGCSNLITAPELPATTLVERCYFNMFNGCSNLNYIKCLATDISATYCTRNWVSGVAASGTFVAHDSSVAWTTGESGIPTNWTVEYVAAGTGSGGDPEED